MYFDPKPKTQKDDLYDFEKEFKEVVTAIKRNERIIVIRGLRRTGKTSLMKVIQNQIKIPSAFLDGRIIEPKRKEVYTSLLQAAIEGIERKHLSLTLINSLKELTINLMGINVGFALRISQAFESLDEYLEKHSQRFVFFLDEVQTLKAGNVDGIIAHLFENTKNFIFVLAGSEVGLLDELVGGKADGHLFGRPKEIIELHPLTRDQSLEFLKKGFEQIHKRPRDLEKYVNELDGIIGWLTLFGYYSIKMPLSKALTHTKKDAAQITAQEIQRFLSNRELAKHRYLHILKAAADGITWTEAKYILEAKEGKPINDKSVSKYLQELIRYGFLVKNKGLYILADPLVKEGIKLLTPGK